MLQLYSWPTPNGHKVHIMLAETGIPYTPHAVDIGAGEQFHRDFLAISPNNKIPAIVDEDGPGGEPFALAESGAILIYLADKAGRLLPQEPRGRHTALQWLMFQMGHVGPMLGQAHHFRGYAPVRVSYGIERYTREANRLYGVLDRRLAQREFLAGEDYTIADIAVFPWLRSHDKQGVDLAEYPHVQRWFESVAARPAVQTGLQVLAGEGARDGDERARFENLFGARQYERRESPAR